VQGSYQIEIGAPNDERAGDAAHHGTDSAFLIAAGCSVASVAPHHEAHAVGDFAPAGEVIVGQE
jgi:hypothetical protein